MAIKWKTLSGLLAIVEEESSIRSNVEVFLQQPYEDVEVEIISGSLPKGISLVERIPHYSYGFEGIAEKIDEDTEYGFTLRAYNDNEISDRYFSLKVVNKLPKFDATQESTIDCIESEYLSLQFKMTDNDSGDNIVKIKGSLPNGLSLNNYGLLYGMTEVVNDTKSYSFTLGIQRDGIIVDEKDFTINIVNIPENASPIWITESGNIGRVDYKETSQLFVKAYDPNNYDNTSLKYELVKGTLPQGLELENLTGRISGILELAETTDYHFTIAVSNDYATIERDFFIQINVLKEEQEISWITDSNLGSVKVGNQYYIEVEAKSDYSIEYHMSSGELPKGLKFKNGLIYGEISYQSYKQYSFIIEATNGFKTINRLFTIDVEQGLGKNAVQCYFYINHENDSEYNDLIASLDKSSAYESSNILYQISNKPLISLCKMKTFDKVLLKDMLYYNRPLNIVWDKSYKKDFVKDGEILYQAFYKGIKEDNSADILEKYDYQDGTSDSVSYPSINGIRQILAQKIYVEKLDDENVLYDVGTQEIVDINNHYYPHYLIEYDDEKQSYVAKSQDEVRYLDVYAVCDDNAVKPVYATIERNNYIGDDNEELWGGNASTQQWTDNVYGGNASTQQWEEIIDSNYGKIIVKPVKVFEERLNTDIDYVNYLVYEKGTMKLQENIIFTLSWKPECQFIILNGKVCHIMSISKPWVYRVALNDSNLHNKDIVLPFVTDEDVIISGKKAFVQFFDINNEVVDAWKTDTIPEWKENSQYIVGDVFVYDNVYYRVLLNFVSTGVFDDSNLAIMSQSEIDTLLEPYYFPTMNILFAKPNTNMFLFQELNKKERKGFFFTGRKFDFFEVHFSPVYNKNIDNFSIDFYNHIQTKSPEFQLI